MSTDTNATEVPPGFITIPGGKIAHAKCVEQFNITMQCGRDFADCWDPRCAISAAARQPCAEESAS